MESIDSSKGIQKHLNLPPGFRFHPTDEELVVYYLKKKATSSPIPVAIIADIDLYKFDPWELPDKAIFGEQEWYFFTPRDRKYPNGARPNRTATSGYWKATGIDKPVLIADGTQKVGVKKSLVFYGGKPPKGIKTSWIMHEYRLPENKAINKPPGYDIGNKKNPLRLDDWVLCRIYKRNDTCRNDHDNQEDSVDNNTVGPILHSVHSGHQYANMPQLKALGFPSLFENDQTNMLDGMLCNGTTMSELASPKAALPLVSSLAAYPSCTNNLPLRRTLSSLCWNDIEDDTAPSQSKRFHAHNSYERCDTTTYATNNNNSSSFATLLSQLPHTSVTMQQEMIGSLFGMNRYT